MYTLKNEPIWFKLCVVIAVYVILSSILISLVSLLNWKHRVVKITCPIAAQVKPKYCRICIAKAGWHRNREVSKDWCFSKLATPRFAKKRKYIRVCKKSNTMRITCWAGTAYPVFTPDVLIARSLVFCVMFCRWLFVLLFFFVWPLYCLWFDIRLLITSLVSSNTFHTG